MWFLRTWTTLNFGDSLPLLWVIIFYWCSLFDVMKVPLHNINIADGTKCETYYNHNIDRYITSYIQHTHVKIWSPKPKHAPKTPIRLFWLKKQCILPYLCLNNLHFVKRLFFLSLKSFWKNKGCPLSGPPNSMFIPHLCSYYFTWSCL